MDERGRRHADGLAFRQPGADRRTRRSDADAGYCGFGLIADDLAVVRDTIGYGALRNLMAEHGLTHIEIELIERWWIPRGEPGHTYQTHVTC